MGYHEPIVQRLTPSVHLEIHYIQCYRLYYRNKCIIRNAADCGIVN